jgi:hypothetical protein
MKPVVDLSRISNETLTGDCTRAYIAAEQWLGTYNKTGNPRHLRTALACFDIADRLNDR